MLAGGREVFVEAGRELSAGACRMTAARSHSNQNKSRGSSLVKFYDRGAEVEAFENARLESLI